MPVPSPEPVDLLARWTGSAWAAEVDAWVGEVLAARGERPTGPGVPLKTRFWSVVRRYETTAGTVWFKESNPGQAFEGPLLQELAALEPDAFPAPLAVDAGHGRVLLPDAGPVRERDGRGMPEPDLRDVLVPHAALQQRLAPHGERLRRAGLPSLTPAELPAWVERLGDELASLPPSDVQHLDRDGVAQVRGGLPRVRAWCARLDDGVVPCTFQHDDLNPWNVAAGPAGPVVFDVGDSFWSHPFAVLQVPLAMATGTWPSGPPTEDPLVGRLVEAYLAAFVRDREGGPSGAPAALSDLRPLVAPALLLAQAHRAESWRRLLAHVPSDRLGADPPLLREHLLRVVGSPA